jgi:hypothetical protein
MEPVFMILGQSAATAACLAIQAEQAVQDVSYEKLKARLEGDGQVLNYEGPLHRSLRPGADIKELSGIVVDCEDQGRVAGWVPSSSSPGFVGSCYFHDDNNGQGQKEIKFEIQLPQAGRFEVRVSYAAHQNRASNVAISVGSEEKLKTLFVDQRKPPNDGLFHSLGVFDFASDQCRVVISNRDADGFVVADALQLLEVE